MWLWLLIRLSIRAINNSCLKFVAKPKPSDSRLVNVPKYLSRILFCWLLLINPKSTSLPVIIIQSKTILLRSSFSLSCSPPLSLALSPSLPLPLSRARIPCLGGGALPLCLPQINALATHFLMLHDGKCFEYLRHGRLHWLPRLTALTIVFCCLRAREGEIKRIDNNKSALQFWQSNFIERTGSPHMARGHNSRL